MSQEPIIEPRPEQSPEPQESGDHPSGWGNLSLWMALGVALTIAFGVLDTYIRLPYWVTGVAGLMLIGEVLIGMVSGATGTLKDKKRTRAFLGLVIHLLFIALALYTLLGPVLWPGNRAD